MSTSGYQWGLAALRRLETWRRDELVHELADLKSRHRLKSAEREKLEALIAGLEGRLLSLLHEQPMFWIEMREAVSAHVADRREERQRVLDEQRRLSIATEDVSARLLEKRQSERSLERHYERGLQRFVESGKRQEAGVLDDLWLNQAVRTHGGARHEN